MNRTRRQLLRDGTIIGGSLIAPRGLLRAQRVQSANDPFSLGVASGYPTSGTVVLWTRLAPEPLAEDGGLPPLPIPVDWELAADEKFRDIVRTGTASALPDLAHSVHVDVEGLTPDRPYWYRFFSGDAISAVGRTRTAPANAAAVSALRFAFACCQHYESGHYAAYAAIADDALDLIIHVGDYIYENPGFDRVRRHAYGEAKTLSDYRQRYALYKLDTSLQRAHASAPWIATWDDHEVANDYAGSYDQQDTPPEEFLQRRAAAYQAWYEHLPLPAALRPSGPDLPLYSRYSYGQLADIYLLDGRQYRSRQACNGRYIRPCPELALADRTMLGGDQERWLAGSFASQNARWNVFAQQTVFAMMDQIEGPEIGFWADGWSGYPAARQRLLDAIAANDVTNPVILSGDIHCALINDVHRRPGDPDSPVAATEIVTTAISSPGPDQAILDAWSAENPNVRYASSEFRGYTRINLGPERLDAELVAVDDVRLPDSGAHVRTSWHVLDGQPGAVR